MNKQDVQDVACKSRFKFLGSGILDKEVRRKRGLPMSKLQEVK